MCCTSGLLGAFKAPLKSSPAQHEDRWSDVSELRQVQVPKVLLDASYTLCIHQPKEKLEQSLALAAQDPEMSLKSSQGFAMTLLSLH